MNGFSMYPTIVTPFQEDGTIDWASLARLVELFACTGCDGVFAVCQSSEMFFISDDEKLELAKHTLALCRKHGMKCVVSGHTQDALKDQIAYLKRVEALHPDAIILVSNRLAAQEEGDEIAVQNLCAIVDALSPDARLGIYECPYPYKRPLSDALLRVMKADGRFHFVKDTCGKSLEIRHRIRFLADSGIALYNANSATLLESMDDGAAGFSGVMLNFLPEFYSLLKRAYQAHDRVRVERAAQFLSALSTIERQNYPANAKYVLMKRGIFTTIKTRNGKPPLSESHMKEMDGFIAQCRYLYYGLQRREPSVLLTGYDEVFPECHAASVLPLENDRVLVVCFAGEYEGADDVGIWLFIREGGAWTRPRMIAKVNDTAHWNPVIYRGEDGIRVLFKVGRTIPQWESYSILSTDGGESWSEPQKLSADNPVGGPVRNKPIQLAEGRMLAPNSDETQEAWLPFIDESTDGGKTFTRLAAIPINREDPSKPDYMTGKGAIQPTLWASSPSDIHALLRTTAGRIFRSDSTDGGKTWCCAYPTNLPNNNSGIDVVRHKGMLYLAMNPVSGDWAERTPLVILKSGDNGANFDMLCTLADELIDDIHGCAGQFCYPAIEALGNRLYAVFTHNRKSIAFCEFECIDA